MAKLRILILNNTNRLTINCKIVTRFKMKIGKLQTSYPRVKKLILIKTQLFLELELIRNKIKKEKIAL